jgi:hypothetical protein
MTPVHPRPVVEPTKIEFATLPLAMPLEFSKNVHRLANTLSEDALIAPLAFPVTSGSTRFRTNTQSSMSTG